MSHEIATVEESSIDLLPPAQPPSIAAQRMLVAHAEMMQTAWQLASKICNTRMVPARFFQKPEDGTAAILYGAELGLNPIQSLQRVVPIHGMPSLEARTMVALLKSRGYKIRTAAQSDESVTIVGVDLEGEAYESTWTIERALKAGYVPEIDERTGKYKTNANGKLKGNEKYITDPQAMLKAKAQAEVCRDMAPEVLLGISYVSEELESERWDDSALPAAEQPAQNAPVTVEEILGTAETAPASEEAQAASETQPETPAQSQPEESAQQQAMGAAASKTMSDIAAQDAQAEPIEAEEVETEPERAPEPEPAAVEPEPEPEPAPAAPKTTMRKALERRLFKLLKAAQIEVENREDRLIVYRGIIDRAEPINSTDDLSDPEVAAVSDQLFKWDKDGELGRRITDILNSASMQEAAAEEQKKQSENNEGE